VFYKRAAIFTKKNSSRKQIKNYGAPRCGCPVFLRIPINCKGMKRKVPLDASKAPTDKRKETARTPGTFRIPVCSHVGALPVDAAPPYPRGEDLWHESTSGLPLESLRRINLESTPVSSRSFSLSPRRACLTFSRLMSSVLNFKCGSK